jgi:hypothetical protein
VLHLLTFPTEHFILLYLPGYNAFSPPAFEHGSIDQSAYLEQAAVVRWISLDSSLPHHLCQPNLLVSLIILLLPVYCGLLIVYLDT